MADYLPFLERMAREYGAPVEEVRAIYNLETSGGRNVQPSSAGAQGHMQLMPATARELGVANINDPYQNIRGGVQYYAQQRKRFGDPALAAAAYNAGPGRVQRAGNRVPQIDETQKYVTNFLKGIGRVRPSQPSPASATVPPTTFAPQGQADMDEPEIDTPSAGALGMVAPSPQEWADIQRRVQEMSAQQEMSSKARFEAGQKLIQQQYAPPSTSERLWALSRALLSPTPYRGFAGTLANVSGALGGMSEQHRAAERKRAEALLGLQKSYEVEGEKRAGGDLDRALELLKLRQTAGKPPKVRTGFNPVTGELVDMDTAAPIKPPPPRAGEIRKGYRYLGGDPAVASSWQKVV